MKVIYAGFSKCATKTIAKALRLLGYNVYDYMENYEHLHDDWLEIYRNGATVEQLQRMYQGVDAVTGMPVYYFWEELLEAFPKAKVIFYERPIDDWYRSVLSQYKCDSSIKKFTNYFSPTSWKYEQYFEASIFAIFGFKQNMTSVFKKTIINEMLLKKAYKMHNSYVKNNVPKEKLLIFHIEEGWAPLCKFLKVEIPDIEFPHNNRKGELIQQFYKSHAVFKKIKFEKSFILYTFIFIIAILSFVFHT